jgi:mRNA-degrading endonuclease RelE of RelBE toxin-antitoxin system
MKETPTRKINLDLENSIFSHDHRFCLRHVPSVRPGLTPIWELRVGEYLVFYDVSPTESVVYVRAVRRKRRGTKTEDIL